MSPRSNNKDHAVSPQFDDPNVERVFAAFPDEARQSLLELRTLIFDVAARNKRVGRLQETLKWGQPAYLTPETKSGSTIRLGLPKSGGFAIYTHCQISIISDFRALIPNDGRASASKVPTQQYHSRLRHVQDLVRFAKLAGLGRIFILERFTKPAGSTGDFR